MVREMHRDMNHLSDTIKELRLEQYLHKIMDVLQEEMNDGRLKTVETLYRQADGNVAGSELEKTYFNTGNNL